MPKDIGALMRRRPLGGVGLVDAAQAVATSVTATGDAFRTESGWARESALSFGFQESPLGFGGIKTVTVRNDGTKPVTYKVTEHPDWYIRDWEGDFQPTPWWDWSDIIDIRLTISWASF